MATHFRRLCCAVWCPTVGPGTLRSLLGALMARIQGSSLCGLVQVPALRYSSGMFLVGFLGLRPPQGSQCLEGMGFSRQQPPRTATTYISPATAVWLVHLQLAWLCWFLFRIEP